MDIISTFGYMFFYGLLFFGVWLTSYIAFKSIMYPKPKCGRCGCTSKKKLK